MPIVKFVRKKYGQPWAIAVAPSYRVSLTLSGQLAAVRDVVVCHTDTIEYGSSTNPGGWCRRYSVTPSWQKCSTCPHRQGITTNGYVPPEKFNAFVRLRTTKLRWVPKDTKDK